MIDAKNISARSYGIISGLGAGRLAFSVLEKRWIGRWQETPETFLYMLPHYSCSRRNWVPGFSLGLSLHYIASESVFDVQFYFKIIWFYQLFAPTKG